ncbi:hypothetical protein ACS0TY_019248 [Phlomoides rotata]
MGVKQVLVKHGSKGFTLFTAGENPIISAPSIHESNSLEQGTAYPRLFSSHNWSLNLLDEEIEEHEKKTNQTVIEGSERITYCSK